LPEGVRFFGAINIQITSSLNLQKNLDKTNKVPVALRKCKTLKLDPLEYETKMKYLTTTQCFWRWWCINRGKGSVNRVIPI
jgi:hypothetical protein